jgi:hypothetical protein
MYDSGNVETTAHLQPYTLDGHNIYMFILKPVRLLVTQNLLSMRGMSPRHLRGHTIDS